MCRKLVGVAALVFLLLVSAGPARAVPIYEGAFLTITDLPGQGTTVGGAFLVAPARDSFFTPFISFCLQEDRSIVKNGFEVFQVVGITTFAEMEMAATGGDDVTKKDPWTPRPHGSTRSISRATGPRSDWARTQVTGLATSAGTPSSGRLVPRGRGSFRHRGCLQLRAAKLVMNAAALAAPTGLGGITALNLIWTRNAYGPSGW